MLYRFYRKCKEVSCQDAIKEIMENRYPRAGTCDSPLSHGDALRLVYQEIKYVAEKGGSVEIYLPGEQAHVTFERVGDNPFSFPVLCPFVCPIGNPSSSTER